MRSPSRHVRTSTAPASASASRVARSGPAGCTGSAELTGTGYEGATGGGTGWLTTTAPVTPGETITLRFIVWDEGDHIYDSATLIDNFRWLADAVIGPVTGRS